MRQETRLFVGNLPHDVDEESLRSRFSLYGDIVNLELKSKNEDHAKKFAFITLSTNDKNVDSCINHFSKKSFQSDQIYVSRARESFLERLQRERQEELTKAENTRVENVNNVSKNASRKVERVRSNSPTIQKKRKLEQNGHDHIKKSKKLKEEMSNKIADARSMHATEAQGVFEKTSKKKYDLPTVSDKINDKKHKFDSPTDKMSDKKFESNKKRLESMKQKLKEFKEKKNIIKSGLFGVDAPNKKVVFHNSDDEEPGVKLNRYEIFEDVPKHTPSRNLFDDGESDDEINFDIKKQFEGRSGQKVLELQSKYKSDKRFVLDERFHDGLEEDVNEDEEIETSQLNEKDKQMNILQNVLGVSLSSVRKPVEADNKKKFKSKIGMLRFDPNQPEHSKFLAPIEEKKQEQGKIKKKKGANKNEDKPIEDQQIQTEVEKVEVSKEQFYQVTDTLKEALVQSNNFSLRSLFKNPDENESKDNLNNEDESFIPIEKQREPKVRNPLDRGEANPFKYDSSDSEDDETSKKQDLTTALNTQTEIKAVWKENLFFAENDRRLIEGLSFFNMKSENESSKDRRGLKILMKKRINNKNRKEQMFKKKIGGRRKPFQKTYRKN